MEICKKNNFNMSIARQHQGNTCMHTIDEMMVFNLNETFVP